MIHKATFDKAFERMEEKSWSHIAVAVDLHDTVFKSNYSEELATEFYPHALESLRLMSDDPHIMMYMYTCTPPKIRQQYREFLASKGINMSTHPEDVMGAMKIRANNFQAFDTKPYFNVLLDDKAGFDPDRDWIFLLTYLKLKDR